MSAFGIVNWLAAIAAAAWLWRIYARERFLFVKPSLLLIVYTHLLYQWPLAFSSATYEQLLPNPYALSVLLHGYVLAGLAFATRTLRADAGAVWSRLTAAETDPDLTARLIACLAVALLALVNVYLSYVPFITTGLDAALFDPESISVAREQSLKLVKDPIPRYAFSLMATSVAHLLAALLVIAIWPRGKASAACRRWQLVLLACCLLVAVFLAAEKSRVVYVLIVGVAVLFWRDGLAFKPAKVAGCALILMLASLALVAGRHWHLPVTDLYAAMAVYVHATVARVTSIPMEVAGWYVHYAQTHGTLGVAAFPKLAALLGIAPVDAPNLIGLAYAISHYGFNKGGFLPTISASAGHLFTYYCYLGMVALPLCLAGLLVLDASLKVYLRLNATVLLACVAAITQQTLMFAQSDYTVSLLSHGFLPTLCLALGLSVLAGGGRPASSPRVSLGTGA